MLDLKAMMRVSVTGRTETFIFLFYTVDPKFGYFLNEATDKSESIQLKSVEKIVDPDVRKPKIPTSVLVEHFNDIGFEPSNPQEDRDSYAIVCDAMIENTRIRDFFQSMVDAVDFDHLNKLF